jgi:hypothetical protein
MNDLDIVVATLRGAIDSLHAREAPLTAIERVKLKSLSLNLEAAQSSMPTPCGVAMARESRPVEHASDPLVDKLRSLTALTRKTTAENSSLLQEIRAQMNRARSLSEAMLQAVALTERTSSQISTSIVRAQASS